MEQDRQERYALLRRNVQKWWNLPLSAELGKAVFLHFIARNEPRLLRYRKPAAIFYPAQVYPTHLNLTRTLRSFLEEVTGHKILPSPIERFYASRSSLTALLVGLVVSEIIFYAATWGNPATVVFVLQVFLPAPLLIGLHRLWLNIRYAGIG